MGCKLTMYNDLFVMAILIMRSSPTVGLSALMTKSHLRYRRDGNGHDLVPSLLIEIQSVSPCLSQKEVG